MAMNKTMCVCVLCNYRQLEQRQKLLDAHTHTTLPDQQKGKRGQTEKSWGVPFFNTQKW